MRRKECLGFCLSCPQYMLNKKGSINTREMQAMCTMGSAHDVILNIKSCGKAVFDIETYRANVRKILGEF